MLSTTGKAGRHGNATFLKGSLRDIPKKSLVKCLQRLVGISQHVPRRRLTLIYTQVVVAIYQRAGQSREEDTNFKVRHFRVTLYDAIFIRVAVKKQQAVLLTESDTSLVENAVVQSDILPFRLRSNLHHLHRLQLNVVSLGKRHHVGNKHRR